MRFIFALIATLATGIFAGVLPHNSTSLSYNRRSPASLPSPNSTVSTASTISYDCGGSIMCATVRVQACDIAVNTFLIRDDTVNYGPRGSGKPHMGVCHGVGTDFGCAIFVEGPANCTRSGNQIWWDYQEIRHSGCHHCGHKWWGNVCSTTIDYCPECGWIY
ncbi:hypothetical protein F5Y04DRAFT_277855 [Hypomontagnella monticulosa]|nr:hypothetical protein F5Y04DRAFT_277855 [Hypomontagnella monticulosa]